MTKPDIDQFFRDNLSDLSNRCTKIVKSKLQWKSNNHSRDADELLSELYLSVYNNIDSFIKSTVKSFSNYCICFLNNQYKWNNSAYRRTYRDISKHKNINYSQYERITDNDDNDEYVVELDFCEQDLSWESISTNAPETMKNYVSRLYASGLNDDAIRKTCAAVLVRQSLTFSDQALFDLYFERDLSTREISTLTKLPLTTVHNMLVNMKGIIKSKTTKMLNG
jgi:RNA polymerase sigma factor (sigma-70 family)